MIHEDFDKLKLLTSKEARFMCAARTTLTKVRSGKNKHLTWKRQGKVRENEAENQCEPCPTLFV